MKIQSQINIECLLALAIACLMTPAVWADTPAFTSGGYAINPPPSFTGTKGWVFGNSGPSDYMAITQLGVFDNGGDGLVNSHQVGLWGVDGTVPTLLASVTIPAGTAAPLIGGYRYMPITPVLIPPGYRLPRQFVVGAEYSADDADDPVTLQYAGLADGVFLSSLRGLGTFGFAGYGMGLPFPQYGYFLPGPEGGQGIPLFAEVNFQFQVVPEPSVSLLLAPGLVWLYLRQRKLG